MSEPDITPLARRLAEQNNVDWRRLQGSGDGGRIVERDVLDFLARVMAGEEAVDPTPEPLPEGMEAWPEQDIASVRQGVGEAATLGELRHEIGSAVREEAPAVDEDVFLFDDEPTPAPPMTEAPAPAAEETAAPASADDLDDLLVSGDEPLPVDQGAGEEPVFGAMAGQDGARPGEDEPTAEPEPGWGHGIHLGQPSHAEAEPEAPDIWGEPAAPAGPDVDLFAEAEDGASPAGPAESTSASADEGPDLWSATTESEEAAEPVAGGEAWTEEPVAGEEAWTETPATRDAGAAYDAWAAPSAWGEGADGGDASTAEETSGATDVDASGTADAAAAEEPAAVVGAAEARDELGAVPSSGFEGLPLARLRLALRRHVDVSALASAQLAVSQELGHEEPLGAAPFVLRAVAKAAAEMGGGFGQVALAAFGEGVTLRRVDGAATRPFAEIVGELSGPGVEEDEAGLVVADLSGLDVDEVVLDLDLPVLSLGRILYDNQRGGYRSTLTLAGDLPGEAGARLLSRVAELLDSPVRLVM